MPYTVTASGAGPWLRDQEIPDEEFEKHPFKDKFLRNGSVVKVNASAERGIDPAQRQAQIADLDARIAQLQAERDGLVQTDPALQAQFAPVRVALGPEPTAPARVSVDIDRLDQPSAAEADATRAEDKEAIQPTPGNVNLGEVVPGEAVEATNKAEAERTAERASAPREHRAGARRAER